MRKFLKYWYLVPFQVLQSSQHKKMIRKFDHDEPWSAFFVFYFLSYATTLTLTAKTSEFWLLWLGWFRIMTSLGRLWDAVCPPDVWTRIKNQNRQLLISGADHPGPLSVTSSYRIQNIRRQFISSAFFHYEVLGPPHPWPQPNLKSSGYNVFFFLSNE